VQICSDPYHTPQTSWAPVPPAVKWEDHLQKCPRCKTGDRCVAGKALLAALLPVSGKVLSYSVQDEPTQTRLTVKFKPLVAPKLISLDEFPRPARPTEAVKEVLARHRKQEADAASIPQDLGIDLRTPAHRDRGILLGIVAALAERLVYSRQEDEEEPYRCDICKETMPGFEDPPDAEEHHRGWCVIPAIKLLQAGGK